MVNSGYRIMLPNAKEDKGYRGESKDFYFLSWMGMDVHLKNQFLSLKYFIINLKQEIQFFLHVHFALVRVLI